MEYSSQALRHCLSDIRHHFCFVPRIQTGDKLNNELCSTYLNHCTLDNLCLFEIEQWGYSLILNLLTMIEKGRKAQNT